MLIATGPLAPLLDFFQALCWIIIPVLFLTLLVTVLHHYAQKKKNTLQPLELNELNLLKAPSADSEGAYLFFDHSGLVQDYQKKLACAHARYAALKKDFDQMEARYKNESNMPASFQFKSIQMENTTVKTQVPSEELYLKDLLEEQKVQISFLQAQVEQRIRKHHETEGEKEQLRDEVEKLRSEKEQLMKFKEEYQASHENRLFELQQQNELLNATAADNDEKAAIAIEQLEFERSRVAHLEEKLQANKQLLHRLYKEFAACVEADEPVVVPMQAAYLNSVVADY